MTSLSFSGQYRRVLTTEPFTVLLRTSPWVQAYLYSRCEHENTANLYFVAIHYIYRVGRWKFYQVLKQLSDITFEKFYNCHTSLKSQN